MARQDIDDAIANVGRYFTSEYDGKAKEGFRRVHAALATLSAHLESSDASFTTLKDQVAADRREYADLWAAQKKDIAAQKAITDKLDDAALRVLVTVSSDASPDTTAVGALLEGQKRNIAALNSIEADITRLKQAQSADSERLDRLAEYARFCANLAYAYALMASHFRSARNHVTAVLAEKSLSDKVLAVGIGICQAAIKAGLEALTAGISGVILKAIREAGAVGEYMVKGDPKTVDVSGQKVLVYKKEKSVLEEGGLEDKTQSVARETLRTTVSKPVGQVTERALGAVGGLLHLGNLMSTELPNKIQDPFDFFLDKERELRQIVATVLSVGNPAELDELPVPIMPGMTFGQLRADPMWEMMFKTQSLEAMNEAWGHVSRMLASNMRRACWRVFCRSQWKNTKYDYTLSVIAASDAAEKGYPMDGPATEWHYKIWANTGGGAPKFWDKICSDFKGPEHDPDNPFTVRFGLVNRAHELMARNAWISLAAVECCQIRRIRHDWEAQGWDIDLEKFGHYGGSETKAPYAVPHGWTDQDLVYGSITDEKYRNAEDQDKSELEAFLWKIRVKGGLRVNISGILVGKSDSAVSWFKATGKKGRLESSNTPEDALPVPADMKWTVLVARSDSSGGSTSSTREAYIRIYRVDTDSDGKLKKHASASDACATENRCWYCLNKTFVKEWNTTYKLVEVDAGTDNSHLVDVGLNYGTFPKKKPLFNGRYGLYCVRLDPRMDLRTIKSTARDLQYHVSDEWWIRITERAEDERTPNKPEIDWKEGDVVKPAKGKKKIKGTYRFRKRMGEFTHPDKTLIHAFVNGKLYGSKEVQTGGSGGDLQTVTWEIAGAEFLGGEHIEVTSTWESSGGRPAAQSERVRTVVVSDAPVVLGGEYLRDGMRMVAGVSNAAEGALIQVMIGGKEVGAPIRLEGPRKFNALGEEPGANDPPAAFIAWQYRDRSLVLKQGQEASADAVFRDGSRWMKLKPGRRVKVGAPTVPVLNGPLYAQSGKVKGTAIADPSVHAIIVYVGDTAVSEPVVLRDASPDADGEIVWEAELTRALVAGEAVHARLAAEAPDDRRSDDDFELVDAWVPINRSESVVVKHRPETVPKINPVWVGEKKLSGTLTVADPGDKSGTKILVFVGGQEKTVTCLEQPPKTPHGSGGGGATRPWVQNGKWSCDLPERLSAGQTVYVKAVLDEKVTTRTQSGTNFFGRPKFTETVEVKATSTVESETVQPSLLPVPAVLVEKLYCNSTIVEGMVQEAIPEGVQIQLTVTRSGADPKVVYGPLHREESGPTGWFVVFRDLWLKTGDSLAARVVFGTKDSDPRSEASTAVVVPAPPAPEITGTLIAGDRAVGGSIAADTRRTGGIQVRITVEITKASSGTVTVENVTVADDGAWMANSLTGLDTGTNQLRAGDKVKARMTVGTSSTGESVSAWSDERIVTPLPEPVFRPVAAGDKVVSGYVSSESVVDAMLKLTFRDGEYSSSGNVQLTAGTNRGEVFEWSRDLGRIESRRLPAGLMAGMKVSAYLFRGAVRSKEVTIVVE